MSEIKKKTLANLEKRTAEMGPEAASLKEMLQWTIIEDRENLDNATMLQASLRFRQWLETDGAQEVGVRPFPARPVDSLLRTFSRYTIYVYVDGDAVESVMDPVRAQEKTGYYVTLVRHGVNIVPEDDDDDDSPDESLMRVRADKLILFFLSYANDINYWYVGWDGPPVVHGAMPNWT